MLTPNLNSQHLYALQIRDMRLFFVLLLVAAASAELAPLLTHSDAIPDRYIVKLKVRVYDRIDKVNFALGFKLF